MNHRLLLLATLILILFSTIPSKAQQNFFNAPSSEITEKGRLFFQQQINLSNQSPVFNTTLDMGVGKNWEIGVNLIDLIFDPNNHWFQKQDVFPCYPFLTVNVSKKMRITKGISFTLGGQIGQSQSRNKDFGYYAYQNISFIQKNHDAKWVIGSYQANNAYFGYANDFYKNGNQRPQSFGIQFGYEKMLIHHQLFFQVDGMYGNANMNQIVPGFAYFMSKNWVLSAGVPIKIGYSTITPGMIAELTFVPN